MNSNWPPAIAEDSLRYALYLPESVSDKTSAISLAACIESHVRSLLPPDFLWHRDVFELKVVADLESKGQPPMLAGRMRVGDCVDDEWCVVWLLRQVSTMWDVAISVSDSDGEFLLIEAANALPSWVSPTNVRNRVWIYRSHLHLIPLSDDESISVMDALSLVKDSAIETRAPVPVENLVWQRIFGYPQAAKNHMHTAKAHLPVDIARALQAEPSLIQKTVETFYTRDAIQLRAAHRMARFPPEPSVLASVKMTRTAYAQLAGQNFYPPKVFGRWTEDEGSREWKWRDVGMKIACGFEMLFQESKSRLDVLNSSTTDNEASIAARDLTLRRDPNFKKYVENLVHAGYFQGEREGSQLWKTLEKKAVAAYINIRRADDATRPSFAGQVTAAISRTEGPPPVFEGEEDSDEWLNVDPEDLNRMLENTFRNHTNAGADGMDDDEAWPEDETQEGTMAREQAARLSDLAKRVQQFVEGEGGLDGALFEDETFSEEGSSDDEGEESAAEENVPQDNANRRAAMDKLVPGLDPSEYGQMPPSFYKSQRVARTKKQDAAVDKPEEPSASVVATPSSPLRTRSIRPPILEPERYEGVESDETDSEEEHENMEDMPQLIGEIDVDMCEEEEEFLEFSRQALGISDAQWGDIIKDRKGRGAYVPVNAGVPTTAVPQPSVHSRRPERSTATTSRPNVNPNLDSFEAVMTAMETELRRSRKKNNPAAEPAQQGKGKKKSEVEEDEEIQDIEAAMDAELKAAIERDGSEDEAEEPMDYGLIKNFLESFKSQGGLSGPVSNLAGRLKPGYNLPRDRS